MSVARQAQLSDFLKRAGWGEATRHPLKGDASTRSYERLHLGGKTAMLMNAPKGEEAPTASIKSTPEERKTIGYNATARLAGPNIEAFLTVSNELFIRGFSTPEIYAADIENGFVLLEDFGDSVYAQVVKADPDCETKIYNTAIDTLAAIYRSSFAQEFSYQDESWNVLTYDETALLAELDLCLDWYAPDLGHEIGGAARSEFYDLWRQAFKHLDVHARGLCLRDFHAENLFWLPERQATSRVGLIDFQDALFVHPAYDLVSLLEDARRDVPTVLHKPLIERFCDKAGLKHDENFLAAYVVMGAQRNTKVIGFPVRADLKFGKPQYRALIPRVRAHLKHDLSHPALADIRDWYARHIPEIVA